MEKNTLKVALFASVMVMVGMLAGLKLQGNSSNSKIYHQDTNSNSVAKVQQALWFIEENYVKEPNMQEMVDNAITGILEGLDPHSFYIPAKEMQMMEEEMEGSFEGIGIEFNLLEDTLYVVAAISGGPSEQVGLQAGDRIVSIDGENVAGVGIANSDVMKKLRGKKGTKVEVGVVRPGVRQELKFVITRDKIPLYSVDYSYMVNDQTGYLKISRFASTTHNEFRDHMKQLKQKGMKQLVLDLRGNPGGYMQMAEKIADEFLSEGKLVVYTEGRTEESGSKYKATDYLDLFEDGPLVILIDYGSASASEIVSGAVQDWDRGLIVGVRSFGKGLVQTQHQFKDGSAMRLVVSQYYTPSGRCIQKPFDKSSEEYDKEILERFQSGEIYDPSKIDLPDSLQFKTNSGRIVYGGGGILPDVFVPRDTTYDGDYMTDLISKNVFRQFSFHYGDLHTDLSSQYPDAAAFVENFKVTDELMEEFHAFAREKGVSDNAESSAHSDAHIRIYVKAFIGRRLYNDDAFYPVYHQADNVLQRAVDLMPQASELKKKGKFTLLD